MRSASRPASVTPAPTRSTCCAASIAVFCEDACPTEAITLGDQYELSFTERRQAIYPKEMLIEPVPAGGQPTPQKTEPGVYTRSVPEMKDPKD